MKRVQRVVVGLSLLLVCGLLISAVVPSVPSGTWQATGDMAASRTGATATVFPDGRLMIVGGTDANGEPLASAELYNADGSVSAAPSMAVARSGHAAIFLYDGRLLVTGGRVSGGGITNSAEVFDPLTNHWQTLSTTLLNARAGHTVSQLPDGSVLIAGGEDSSGPVSALEVFDLYNEFNAAGSLNTARKDHAAAVLSDGRVLIAGGTGYAADSSLVTLKSSEIYDPETNSVSAGPNLSVARAKHSATTLLDGRVLIAGGNNGSNDLASAEIYNPATGAITATDSMSAPRSGHTALLLPNNNAVLIAGGTSVGADSASAELYESWNNAFKSTGSMTAARTSAAASATAYDGLAMLAGGSNLTNTELYGFATVKTDKSDYVVGEIVTISGSGWQAGETVALKLHEVPLADPDRTLYAVADANGNISNQELIIQPQHAGVRFWLTAVGSRSVAYNTFTDALQYTVAINPTSANAGTATSYTVTFTNTSTPNDTSNSMACGRITIPSGVTGVSSLTVVATEPDSTTRNWGVSVSGTTIQAVRIQSGGGAQAHDIDSGGTVAVSFTATSTSGSKTWLTSANANTNCTATGQILTRIGSDPSVNVAAADTTPPDTSITANPPNPSNSSSASFSFTGTDNVTPAGSLTFECKLDLGSFAACSSPQSYSGLADGSHTFEVRAKDAANLVDATPASYTWVVDTGAPDTTITANPAALTNSTSASFSFSATESPATFECKLDAGAFVACTSPQNYSSLAEGSHIFQVRAKDSANNVDQSPASYSWTIDTTAPTFSGARVTAANPNGWNNTDVVVEFTCTDPNGIGSINVTSGGTGTSNTSPLQVTVSTEAANQTVQASCTDAAGNSANASVTDINIDKTNPTATLSVTAGTAGSNGWYTSDVTVHTAGTDALSTIDFCTTDQFQTTETAGAAFNGSCTDKAGNVGNAAPLTVKLDKTGPSATLAVTAGTLGNNGWYTTDVTISASGTDSISGPVNCTADQYQTTDTLGVTFNGSCTNDAGLSTNASPLTVKLDKTAPTTTFVSRTPAANSYGWNNTDVTVQWSCADATSGPTSATTSQTVSTEGENQSGTGTCTDNAGNTSSDTQTGINIDKTAPTINASRTPGANVNGWNNTDVTANYTASDGLSGLVDPTAGSFNFTSEGANQSHTFTVTDKAGNSASATVNGVNIDKTAPSVTATPSPAPNSNGWNNSNVTITFGGTDALSGLDTCDAPTVLSSEGANQSATGSCTDKAGNSASASASGINIDKTAPTLSFDAATPAANSNGWNKTDVSIPYTPADALSGVDTANPASPLVISTEGMGVTGSVTVTDKAGNSATFTSSPVNIDKTAPTINASRAPLANVHGWNNTDVLASYTASDALSGLDPVGSGTGSRNFTSEGAGQSHTFTVTDMAGNSASATISGVNIDKTLPTASASASPGPNSYGWNNTSVTVSFSGADGLSGIQSCASPIVLASEGAGQSANGTCTDKAGNISPTATASGINIDLTQPVVAVTGVTNGANYTLGAVPAAGCSTSDALSGVATGASLSVSGGVPPGVGTFTASCNGAIDKAGNAKNTSVTYSVQYATGGMCLGSPGHQILEPINANGTSVFKQKSTVPAKFRVCDANGNSIGTPGVVTAFRITQDLNGTLSPTINEPVDSTTPFTEFRWDPTSMQWIFNINTKGLSANHTYGFLITLNDGTTIPFMFGLK